MKEKGCIFCELTENHILENDHCYAIYDMYPVTLGHMIIIPKRHFAYYFGINHEENQAIFQLLDKAKNILVNKYDDITGFNIGVNVGEDAGQTIFHCHVHLIPRRKGDLENPKGGVRGVFPDKRGY